MSAAPEVRPRRTSRAEEPLRQSGSAQLGDVVECRGSGLRYTVEGRLGQGSFGSVWRCRNTLGLSVAMKLLPTVRPADLAKEVSLQRKAVAAAGECSVPKLHDAGEGSILGLSGSFLFVAMDFIDGTTARRLAEEASFQASMGPCKAVLHSVGAALARLHSVGILHRDIKAENVMVSKDGTSYLCDFGISAQEEEIRGPAKLRMGTVTHMAPELCETSTAPLYSERSDVWAFGVLAYELAAGRTPVEQKGWGRLTPSVVMRLVAMAPAKRLPRLQGFDESFFQLLGKLLAKSVADRPPMAVVLQQPFLGSEDHSSQNSWSRAALSKALRRSKLL